MYDSGLTRILILVQTDPTLSKKYTETVCTAGLEMVGESEYRWIRLYPIVKRTMGKTQEYSKYQWIRCRLRDPDSNQDTRPESHKVFMDTIEPLAEKISTGRHHDWAERRHFLLESGLPVYTNKAQILEAAARNEMSLCFFCPSRVVQFKAHSQDSNYSPEEMEIIENAKSQAYLTNMEPPGNFRNVPFRKIPYRFSCSFSDDEGFMSELSILDWEMSSLMRNEIKRLHDEELAKDSTLKKYNAYIETCDLHFVLGTRLKKHNALMKNPSSNVNPWSIISVIPFPKLEDGVQGFLNL